MTCKEIYEMINAHTERLSIFICANNWANTDDGELVFENMREDLFYRLFGTQIPTDWSLCCDSDSGWVELGFLF